MIMKRILLYLSTIVLAASCSGTVDPDNKGQGDVPDEFTEPFTLSVDKAQVEARGKDIVTFSLKDAYGREMLDDNGP